MNYRSYADLARDTWALRMQLPASINAVLGIPRSGMLPASMLAQWLGVPMGEVNSFAANRQLFTSGNRLNDGAGHTGLILVVDDSVYRGSAMHHAKKSLRTCLPHAKFIYAAVYRDSDSAASLRTSIDYFAVDLPRPRYFQWNLPDHPDCGNFMFDIDGVLCHDPTVPDNDDDAYVDAITNAKPLFRPSRPIGPLVTNRLERWRGVTEMWLKENKIEHGPLIMSNHETAKERREAKKRAEVRSGFSCGYGAYKGYVYRESDCVLLVESNREQAWTAAIVSGKPVLCYSTGELFDEGKIK